jgi:hypothetical protein
MAYIDKSDIEKFLNIQLNVNGTNTVNQIITGIEAFIDGYCNRTWSIGSSTDITEKFDGGGVVYPVTNPKIASVSSVAVDGEVLTADDFKIYDTYVELTSRSAKDLQNVVIVYKTAANTAPLDLKHAIIRWVSEIFKSSSSGGKSARRVQQGPVSIDYEVSTKGIPADVQMILDRYRLFNV